MKIPKDLVDQQDQHAYCAGRRDGYTEVMNNPYEQVHQRRLFSIYNRGYHDGKVARSLLKGGL